MGNNYTNFLQLRTIAITIFFFNRIFVHRYRDTKAFIRELSLKALASWMAAYPDHFVKNDFLKYIGWCLNDQVGKQVIDIDV